MLVAGNDKLLGAEKDARGFMRRQLKKLGHTLQAPYQMVNQMIIIYNV